MQIPILGRSGQTKPFGSIPRINRAHPLSFGLNSFIAPTSFGDPEVVLGRSGFVTPWANGSISGTAVGPGLRVAPGTSTSLSFELTKTSAPATGDGDYTIVALIYLNAFTGTDFLGQIGVGDTGFYRSGGGGQLSFYRNGTSLNALAVPALATLYAVVGTRLNNVLNLYINGVSQGTATQTGQIYSAGGTTYYLGGYGGSSNSTDVTLLNYGGWNRALSPQEVLEWSLDPYCFLIYPEDEIFATFVGVTAGGGDALQGAQQRFFM